MAEKKKMNKGLLIGICAGAAAVIAVIVTVVLVIVTRPTVIGRYNFTSTIDQDGNESELAANFFKAFGANYTIEFRSDKTGEIRLEMGSSFLSANSSDEIDENVSNTKVTTFTYDDKKINASGENGEFESDYEFKTTDSGDETVVLTIDGEKVKFTKEKQE